MARSRVKARPTGRLRARASSWSPERRVAPAYKAQNNTQSIITDPDTVSRFSAELVAEHMTAQKQAAAAAAAPK